MKIKITELREKVLQTLSKSFEPEAASKIADVLLWADMSGIRPMGVAKMTGTKHLNYLQENLGALDVELSAEDLQRLDEAAPAGTAAGDRYPDMSTINK